MDDVMQNFLRNAKRLGLCEEYTGKWTSAKSKKQLIDLALDANGLDYVANAVAKGYLSSEYICEAFAPFNNGKYVRNKDGYTSALYCGEDTNEIFATETALLVIDFVGDIYIPENRICEIHLVNSKCYIVSKGKGNVYIYGNTEVYNENGPNMKILGRD